MKKLFAVVMALCIVMAVAAQHGRGGGGRGRVVVVRPSFGFGYSSFYSPYGYYPYGNPYGLNGYNGFRHESKLDMKVNDIRMDFKDKIKSAKHDQSMTKDERKKIVKQLKADRDRDIHDLKTNYYRRKTPAPAEMDGVE